MTTHRAAVVGYAHSAIQRRGDRALGALAVDVARAAISDAGLSVDQLAGLGDEDEVRAKAAAESLSAVSGQIGGRLDQFNTSLQTNSATAAQSLNEASANAERMLSRQISPASALFLALLRPNAIKALSCGHTEPLW